MIRKARTAVLAGIAALAVAGVGLAAARDAHTLRVDLPDGSVARIEYSGGVAPQVTLARLPRAVPVAFADGFDGMPFAALNHAAAEMDRQAAAMIHQAAQLQALPMLAQEKLATAALRKLPSGMVHYELVTTRSGNGACTRSVEMTSYGPDEKPSIVSTNSGDCSPLERAPVPVRLDTPVHPPIPRVAKPRMADHGDSAQAHTIV